MDTYTTVNRVIIGSGICLSPARCQANTKTKANIQVSKLEALEQNVVKMKSKYIMFLSENAFENVVYKISVILFMFQYLQVVTCQTKLI